MYRGIGASFCANELRGYCSKGILRNHTEIIDLVNELGRIFLRKEKCI